MQKDVAVILSGGAARGAAHIGVLQALNELDIYPHYMSAVSSGAVIAALYCNGYTPLEILELTKEKEFLDIFRIGLVNKKFTDHSRLRKFLSKHLTVRYIEDLPMPFYISVSNLNTGEAELFNTGELIPIVLASCAIPIMFKPVTLYRNLYADGGLLNDLPVEPFLHKHVETIGVSITNNRYIDSFGGLLSIMERCMAMALWNNIEPRLKLCDVKLTIEDAFKYGMFDLKKSEDLFSLGYQQTLEAFSMIPN